MDGNDVADDAQCANGECVHPGAIHEDTPNGKNTGPCTDPNCTCNAMVDSGQKVPDAPGGAPAPGKPAAPPAKSGTPTPPPPPTKAGARGRQYAPAPGAPDAAPDAPAPDAPDQGGGAPDAEAASQAAVDLDDLVDQAQTILSSLDASVVTPNVKQLKALIDSVDNSVDMLRAVLGVTDPDDGDVTPPSDVDSAGLAQAADASLDAAGEVAKSIDATTSDELDQALQLVTQAQSKAGDLLTALGEKDPDDDPDYTGPGKDGDQPNDASKSAPPTPAPSKGAPAPDVSTSSRRRQFAEDRPAIRETDDVPAPPENTGGQRFKMPVMVLEGVDTGDGRRINPEALTWRELPVPLMAITKTTMGHDDAELVGRIETIERVDASQMSNPKTGELYGEGIYALVGEGTFTDLENAVEVADLIGDGFLRGVSVDISDVVSEMEINGGEEGDPEDEGDLLDLLFMDFGDVTEVLIEGRVMGCTVCPFPAFEGAYIELSDGRATDPTAEAAAPSLAASARPAHRISVRIRDVRGTRQCKPCQGGQPLTASAGPMYPPKSWFEDPQLDGPTPMTITSDGRIFGHLAGWGDCHTGFPGHCVTPPHSKMDYGVFMTGEILTREGELVPIGNVTMDTGHAGGELGAAAAIAHYDDTGTVAADVAMGEDQHGVWYAGALRPDMDELKIRKLRASGLSGDWRQIHGNLELIGALAVNVQGYPRPRSRVASGAPVSLVAAGGQQIIAAGIKRSNARDLKQYEELRRVSSWVNTLVEERVRELRTRAHGGQLERLRKRVHSSATT